jgi:aconitate hydratase 2/2-methylisocitrate dehydratase
MGADSNVYLASAELASVCSVLGRIPTLAEYAGYMAELGKQADDTYRYMNFDQLPEYRSAAAS